MVVEDGVSGKGKLTLVHKTNVLTFAGDLWQRAFNDVAAAETVNGVPL